jgi:hypothetical protein
MSMRQSRSPLQRRVWRPLGNAGQAKENTREAGCYAKGAAADPGRALPRAVEAIPDEPMRPQVATPRGTVNPARHRLGLLIDRGRLARPPPHRGALNPPSSEPRHV